MVCLLTPLSIHMMNRQSETICLLIVAARSLQLIDRDAAGQQLPNYCLKSVDSSPMNIGIAVSPWRSVIFKAIHMEA